MSVQYRSSDRHHAAPAITPLSADRARRRALPGPGGGRHRRDDRPARRRTPPARINMCGTDGTVVAGARHHGLNPPARATLGHAGRGRPGRLRRHANTFEGASRHRRRATPRRRSAQRHGADTDDNCADFTTAAPTPTPRCRWWRGRWRHRYAGRRDHRRDPGHRRDTSPAGRQDRHHARASSPRPTPRAASTATCIQTAGTGGAARRDAGRLRRGLRLPARGPAVTVAAGRLRRRSRASVSEYNGLTELTAASTDVDELDATPARPSPR